VEKLAESLITKKFITEAKREITKLSYTTCLHENAENKILDNSARREQITWKIASIFLESILY
jgi:hypothetical protein